MEDKQRMSDAEISVVIPVYGSGGQTRGFIALRDAMQCMTRLILSPPEPGQYDVVNQGALPSVQRSIDDPITTNEVNVNGTLNVLLASCKRC